jgi:hypothetical protein
MRKLKVGDRVSMNELTGEVTDVAFDGEVTVDWDGDKMPVEKLYFPPQALVVIETAEDRGVTDDAT